MHRNNLTTRSLSGASHFKGAHTYCNAMAAPRYTKGTLQSYTSREKIHRRLLDRSLLFNLLLHWTLGWFITFFSVLKENKGSPGLVFLCGVHLAHSGAERCHLQCAIERSRYARDAVCLKLVRKRPSEWALGESVEHTSNTILVYIVGLSNVGSH